MESDSPAPNRSPKREGSGGDLQRLPVEHVLAAVERVEVALEGRQHGVGDGLGVQPPSLWATRIGRFWLIRKISSLRTAKIWPDTSLARSLARNTQIGAIFDAVMVVLTRSTRAFCSGVSTGMVPISRDQANGDTQLERTLKRAMSSAIDFDRPTMPSLAAA